MTFLVEGILSKKAPMTGGGCQPVEGLWRFLISLPLCQEECGEIALQFAEGVHYN